MGEGSSSRARCVGVTGRAPPRRTPSHPLRGSSPKGEPLERRVLKPPPLGEVAAKPTERATLCDHGNQTTIGSAMKPDSIKKNNLLLDTARELRQTMTKQEKHLWYDFLRYYPIKIYKQRIIDSFIVDFYCAKAKLVIELDGAQHYTPQGKKHDRLRTEALQKYDLMVLRFQITMLIQNSIMCAIPLMQLFEKD